MPKLSLEQLKAQANYLSNYRDAAKDMVGISDFWDAEYLRADKAVQEMEQEIAQMDGQQ